MSDKLRLPELSNSKFYKKLHVAITGAYDASQPKGGINARFYKQVVGSKRSDDNEYNWSEPRPEKACERPFVNMAPLFPDSEPVIVYHINYATVRHAPALCCCCPSHRCARAHASQARSGAHACVGEVAGPLSTWLRRRVGRWHCREQVQAAVAFLASMHVQHDRGA